MASSVLVRNALVLSSLMGFSACAGRGPGGEGRRRNSERESHGECDPLDGTPLAEPDFVADTIAHASGTTCSLRDMTSFRPELPIYLPADSRVDALRNVCQGVESGCQDLCLVGLAAEVGRRLYFEVASSMHQVHKRGTDHSECGATIASSPNELRGEAARQLWSCLAGPLPDRIAVEMSLSGRARRRQIDDVRVHGRFVPPLEGLPAARDLTLVFQAEYVGCGRSEATVALLDPPEPKPRFDPQGPCRDAEHRSGRESCVLLCGEDVQTCSFSPMFQPFDAE